MQVSIIIINYNTFRMTSDCIRSVIRETRGLSFEIILVDNASTETDPGKFLEEFPDIKLVRNPENTGFADGNNRGIAEAKGEWILLLNSDTILTEDSITRSVQRAVLDQAGILGCRMVYPDGSLQYSARRFRSLGWELLDLFRFIPWMMSYEKRSRIMLGKYFRHDEDVLCDWVNGAFFLIHRKLISLMPAGRLDDRFFMYGEDHLWCYQARSLGFRVLFYAGTTIVHINSGSTSPARQLRLRQTMRRHELEIMRERKGHGLYYYAFALVFSMKEFFRNLVKAIVLRSSGRLVR